MSNVNAFVPSRRLGVVGLGLVGCALAQRLTQAGYTCVGYDVREAAMRAFADSGHTTCAAPEDLLHEANTLVLAVFDTDGVEAVVQALLEARTRLGLTSSPLALIDCSTGDPERLAALAQRLAALGIRFVEAPLSGSSAQIAQGQATLLTAGAPQDVAAVAPVLEAISPQRIAVGLAGMAARAKLATNLVLGLNRAALAEGFVLAESMGITPQAFLQLVLASPARSDAALAKGEMMVRGEFAPQSRIRQHAKDVQLMLSMADRTGQHLPLSATHAQLLQRAIEAGDGELDNAAILRQIQRERRP